MGREQEQLLLLRSVSAWEDDERPLVATLRGLAGVGKTALGHRVARTLRKQMGGGQGQVGVLYVDLEHHRRDGGVDVSEALAHLLRGFGLRGAWLPTAVEERADRYLELTRDHRLVVVIDNVRSGAEAVPLLPDSEKSVAVLVSHAPLYDLARPDVVDVHLAPLTDEEALRLLSERAGGARLAEDPETARRLVCCERSCAKVAWNLAGWMYRSVPVVPSPLRNGTFLNALVIGAARNLPERLADDSPLSGMIALTYTIGRLVSVSPTKPSGCWRTS
ncbi:hypothetical protein ACH40E_32070 [Streptomyces acidicola]|uniref:hypothetical protein n=1 Tax=Streptomyces acidicola TaxID=2596892 RepID=UPI0037B76605